MRVGTARAWTLRIHDGPELLSDMPFRQGAEDVRLQRSMKNSLTHCTGNYPLAIRGHGRRRAMVLRHAADQATGATTPAGNSDGRVSST